MGKVGLDTQDRLVERLRQSPLLTKLCNEAASALGDRDAKIAELERENSELRTQDDPAFTYAFVLRAREAEAQVAELTQKLERATGDAEVSRKLHAENVSTMDETRKRLKFMGKYTGELDVAIEEIRAFLDSGASQNG